MLVFRNILIAENGSAKISDFGLSRDIYHNSTYRKGNEKSPLPVKWMAPESLRAMEFSTQSDVWSYGILLWEMFSLGLMPYPGIAPGSKFVESIFRGERMERPEYSPPDVYRIMLECWKEEPSERIPFERICQLWQRRLRDSSTFAANNTIYLSGLDTLSRTPTFNSREPATLKNGKGQAAAATASLMNEEGTEREMDSDGYLISLKSPKRAEFLDAPSWEGGNLISLKTPTK